MIGNFNYKPLKTLI